MLENARLFVKYPNILNNNFWQSFIIFLAYMMCDFQKDMPHLYISYVQIVQKMLVLSQNKGIRNLGNALLPGVSMIKHMKDYLKLSLNIRFEIVWTIQNYIYQFSGYIFDYKTIQSLQEFCTKSIVK